MKVSIWRYQYEGHHIHIKTSPHRPTTGQTLYWSIHGGGRYRELKYRFGCSFGIDTGEWYIWGGSRLERCYCAYMQNLSKSTDYETDFKSHLLLLYVNYYISICIYNFQGGCHKKRLTFIGYIALLLLHTDFQFTESWYFSPGVISEVWSCVIEP